MYTFILNSVIKNSVIKISFHLPFMGSAKPILYMHSSITPKRPIWSLFFILKRSHIYFLLLPCFIKIKIETHIVYIWTSVFRIHYLMQKLTTFLHKPNKSLTKYLSIPQTFWTYFKYVLMSNSKYSVHAYV